MAKQLIRGCLYGSWAGPLSDRDSPASEISPCYCFSDKNTVPLYEQAGWPARSRLKEARSRLPG